jgi:hypothetical protein
MHAKLCSDFKDDTIITVFEEMFNKLKSNGYIPTFIMTDNQVTAPIMEFLKKKGCKWQFVKSLICTSRIDPTQSAYNQLNIHK